METIEKTIPSKTYTETRLNLDGETDGKFTVGDEIKSTMYKSNGAVFGKLNGKITEIFISEERGIHQLKINNGWCTHPDCYYGNDHVYITKKFGGEKV